MRTNSRRFALVVALLVPFALIGLGAVEAQFRPPGGGVPQPVMPQPVMPQPVMPQPVMPQPVMPQPPGGGFKPPSNPGVQIPKIETVWTCGNCGKEISRGAFAPASCPFCGTKLINGVGNGGDNPFRGNGGQPAINPGSGPGGNVPPPGGGKVGSPPPVSPAPAAPAPLTPAPSSPPPSSSDTPSSSPSSSSSSSSNAARSVSSILIIAAGAILFIVLIVLAIGACFLLRFIINSADSGDSTDTPSRSRRKARTGNVER